MAVRQLKLPCAWVLHAGLTRFRGGRSASKGRRDDSSAGSARNEDLRPGLWSFSVGECVLIYRVQHGDVLLTRPIAYRRINCDNGQ